MFAYSLMMLCLGRLFRCVSNSALNTVATLVVLAGLYQVGRCVLEFTPWNVFPFIPDIDEMVSRQRREGVVRGGDDLLPQNDRGYRHLYCGAVTEWRLCGRQPDTAGEAIHTIAMLMFIGTAGLPHPRALWQALTFHLKQAYAQDLRG